MNIDKASPEAWREITDRARWEKSSACIMELLGRVALLEATQHVHIVTSDKGTSYCALAEANAKPTVKDSLTVAPSPAGSLVERVAGAIISVFGAGVATDWEPEVRAAIREVAAALREVGSLTADAAAQWLEQEAER